MKEKEFKVYEELKFSNSVFGEVEIIQSDELNIRSIKEWSNSFWDPYVFKENDKYIEHEWQLYFYSLFKNIGTFF